MEPAKRSGVQVGQTRTRRAVAGEAMQKKKALIIENDAIIRECIEVMYEAEGLAVISARDGKTGLELTHAHQPDLVVSDLYLVGLSGIDIFERLRADPRTGHRVCQVFCVNNSSLSSSCGGYVGNPQGCPSYPRPRLG